MPAFRRSYSPRRAPVTPLPRHGTNTVAGTGISLCLAKCTPMQLQQALADLAEVRDRLAHVQRFDGYSGWAAIASGLGALVGGGVQFALAPYPHAAPEQRIYLIIWLGCLV